MSIPYAFVTLLTSDAYLPGALTVAAALKDVHLSLPSDQTVEYETVCLVTPETVDITTIRLLRQAFNAVVGVEIIVPPEADSLTLLGRPDLETALTKLHVFRLTQYSKVIFLDADVLPLRPLSHLFRINHEFSAVPDVGWPDIFNSGVMVLSPGEDKFKDLQDLLNIRGTWDGADQGLLNEWRGNNWNRLSFTYNTTPTAIYTYAPAYKRFGPQIAAVHFIGTHKPWHSIAYRAPGDSSAQLTQITAMSTIEASVTQQPAYDYGSLVDRWYSVYDRHYRSRATEPVFQPSRYTSVWNVDGPRRVIVTGGVLGLEELRRVALEGTEASGISGPQADGEGYYRTMPLEGRFDLIRPRTRAERKQEQVPKDDTKAPESASVPTGSVTPEPTTPPAQTVSLPSGSPARWTTLPTPDVHEIPPAPHTRPLSLPPTPIRYIFTPLKLHRKTREVGAQTVLTQTPQQAFVGGGLFRTHLMSSPSIETPPNVAISAPTDTYFPKVWDTDRNWSSMSPSSSETSLTTLEPSPTKPQPTPIASITPTSVPTTPEMPYRQAKLRSVIGRDGGSPTPDPKKVKRVFPWEERPRLSPGRVFPGEAPLAPPTSHPRFPVTPNRKSAFRSPIPSPLAGFPPSLQLSHPSDHLSSQKQAGLEHELETGSRDGDVEDEIDSEEETTIRSRTRSSTLGVAMRTVTYRSIGVQTDPRELREEGIQATAPAFVAGGTEQSMLTNKRLRRIWFASAGTPGSPSLAALHHATSSPLSRPTFSSHDSPSPSGSHEHDERASLTPVEADNLSSVPSVHFDSCVTPRSPNEGPRPRKGSRVWDPSRGVEAFKQGSQEVLAKFMKTGSWEEPA